VELVYGIYWILFLTTEFRTLERTGESVE
jgi:hypothetical protein